MDTSSKISQLPARVSFLYLLLLQIVIMKSGKAQKNSFEDKQINVKSIFHNHIYLQAIHYFLYIALYIFKKIYRKGK